MGAANNGEPVSQKSNRIKSDSKIRTSNLSVGNCSALAIAAESPQRRGLLGHRERQSDRRKLLPATMSPTANACGLVAESATASLRAGTPKKNSLENQSKNNFIRITWFYIETIFPVIQKFDRLIIFIFFILNLIYVVYWYLFLFLLAF